MIQAHVLSVDIVLVRACTYDTHRHFMVEVELPRNVYYRWLQNYRTQVRRRRLALYLDEKLRGRYGEGGGFFDKVGYTCMLSFII